MFKSKVKKAPQYFLDMKEEITKLITEASEMLGFSGKWLEEKLQSGLDKKFIEERIQNKNELRKFAMLIGILDDYSNYNWARFRYDNLDNEFGVSGHLQYLSDKKQIKIVKDIGQEISDFMEKLKGKFPGIKETEIIEKDD